MFRFLNCLISRSPGLGENKGVASAIPSVMLCFGSPRKWTQVVLGVSTGGNSVGLSL